MVASQQISEKYGCFATKVMKRMVAAQQSVCETNKASKPLVVADNYCVYSCWKPKMNHPSNQEQTSAKNTIICNGFAKF
jgi:hypothetical protein